MQAQRVSGQDIRLTMPPLANYRSAYLPTTCQSIGYQMSAYLITIY